MIFKQNNSTQKQEIMRTILFIVWVLSALAFFYHALWCEPTLQNIQHTIFFGCVYIITYHEWKDEEKNLSKNN
jgi:hypothetical protein